MNDMTFPFAAETAAAHPAASRPAGARHPQYDAEALTRGGNLAEIVLGEQIYTLRITRAGKLILTK